MMSFFSLTFSAKLKKETRVFGSTHDGSFYFVSARGPHYVHPQFKAISQINSYSIVKPIFTFMLKIMIWLRGAQPFLTREPKICSNWKSIGATGHGNYANRKRQCGDVQKNALQSFRCFEFHQNLCEELKKSLHGLDALRELKMLVADLMCVNMPIGP